MYFDPITIGLIGQRFIDGAVIHNNPINVVYGEALDLWPGQDLFLLSLGTGQAPGKNFGQTLSQIISSLQRLVSDTQEKANRFRTEHQSMVLQQRLFRFDVTHGLAEVGLEEYKSVDVISDATQHYLDSQEISDERMKCVTSLCGSLNAVRPASSTSDPPRLEIGEPSQSLPSIMLPPPQSESFALPPSSERLLPDSQISAVMIQDHGR